jgi:hypothetical protein
VKFRKTIYNQNATFKTKWRSRKVKNWSVPPFYLGNDERYRNETNPNRLALQLPPDLFSKTQIGTHEKKWRPLKGKAHFPTCAAVIWHKKQKPTQKEGYIT